MIARFAGSLGLPFRPSPPDVAWLTPLLGLYVASDDRPLRELRHLEVRSVLHLRSGDGAALAAGCDGPMPVQLGADSLDVKTVPLGAGTVVTVDLLDQGASWVLQSIAADRRVVIGPDDGDGATQAMAAAVLVRMGYRLSEALFLVRAYPDGARLTEPQLDALRAFAGESAGGDHVAEDRRTPEAGPATEDEAVSGACSPTAGSFPVPLADRTASTARRSGRRRTMAIGAASAIAMTVLAGVTWSTTAGQEGTSALGRAVSGEGSIRAVDAAARRPAADATASTVIAPVATPLRYFAAPATPSASAGVAGAATTAQSLPAAPTTFRAILDERFIDVRGGWPNDPRSTAWLAERGYHLYARQPSRFVAVGVPSVEPLRDVAVTAAFRKVGGPPGGGYGVILRDQEPSARDGVEQSGRYYVLGASDRGEVGVWRREGEYWVDLLPWTESSAVRVGGATNELTARAVGQRLALVVNGVEVAAVEDLELPAGGVGVFVGGDFNEVVLERFAVEIPE